MHPESTKADVAAAIVRGLKQAAGKAAIAAGSGTPAVPCIRLKSPLLQFLSGVP